jgi:hypothetical protein
MATATLSDTIGHDDLANRVAVRRPGALEHPAHQ